MHVNMCTPQLTAVVCLLLRWLLLLLPASCCRACCLLLPTIADPAAGVPAPLSIPVPVSAALPLLLPLLLLLLLLPLVVRAQRCTLRRGWPWLLLDDDAWEGSQLSCSGARHISICSKAPAVRRVVS